MTKKVLSAIVAFAMVFQGVVAFAATDPTPAAGSVTIEDYTDDMSTTLLDGVTSADTASIAVFASVAANGPMYKIGVSWGKMTFKFNAPSAWDPISHTYNSDTTGGIAQWIVDGEDGVDNRITITSDSAFAIGATFDYQETTPLNTKTNDPNKVVPLFRLDNDDIKSAETELKNTGSGLTAFATGGLTAGSTNTYFDSAKISVPALANAKAALFMPTSDAFQPLDGACAATGFAANKRTCDVFFGFAGTPDSSAFDCQPVGNILINFYPCKNIPGLNFENKPLFDRDTPAVDSTPSLQIDNGEWL